MTWTPGTTRRGLLGGASALGTFGLTGAWLRTARAQSANGTLTVGMAATPVTCDPINNTNHDAMIIGQTIFENLVEYDINGVLRPQLAKAMPTVSDDRLTYTFELREDVLFQDGQPLTSEDVKYSFDYLLDPAHKAVRRPVFDRIVGVDTDGAHKVHVHLREPYSPWLSFLTKFMGIWPKGSREKLGEDYFRLKPANVGTGPGIFEEWKPNDYISFRRNPKYWQKDLPHWERLVVKIVPETATRVAYLLNGEADIISAPPPRDFAKLKERKGIAGEALATLGGWTVMFMNSTRPPFDDVNFRLAMAHAVDRKTIAEKIYHGLIEKTAIPAPPAAWWYNEKADQSLDYNLEKAKSYLAKSKYANGASFELLTPSDVYLLDTKDMAVFLQAELAKINVKVNLRFAQDTVVSPAMLRGEFDAMLRNTLSPGEPSFLIMTNFTPNQVMSKTSGFADPRVAELLKKAFAEVDQDKQKPYYTELMEVLAETSPYVWVGFFDAVNLWRQRVKNFKPNRGLTISVRDVSLTS